MMNINQIKQYLPHRYPFLYLDRVTELEVGKSIKGFKNLTINEPFFSGHFPVRPIMPGVLMIEAMAQISGILIFKTLDKIPTENDLYFFAGIDTARFKRVVEPGDCLELAIEVIKSRSNLWKFKGLATVDGEIACEAEFMTIKGTK